MVGSHSAPQKRWVLKHSGRQRENGSAQGEGVGEKGWLTSEGGALARRTGSVHLGNKGARPFGSSQNVEKGPTANL